MIKNCKNILLAVAIIGMLLSIMPACNNTRGKCDYSVNIESTLAKLKDIGMDIPSVQVNKTDSHGKKRGLWIKETANDIILSTYNAGIKDGPEIWYDNRPNRIRIKYMIDNRNDMMHEIITFSSYGIINGIIQRIEDNSKLPELKQSFPYMGYVTLYKNGRIASEGYAIFGEDWQSSYKEIGKWKYYDEEGDCTIKNLL